MLMSKEQWFKYTIECKQDFSDKGLKKNKNKISLEKFEQFEEFINKLGYFIKYNKIIYNFEFYCFEKGKGAEYLAENVPFILREKLKERFKDVSRHDTIDYITRYATRYEFNSVIDLMRW